ncbi:MAG: hypothetical protein VW644_06060 [Alphaproteobacteria bacterium]|jgi:hypothetical protein
MPDAVHDADSAQASEEQRNFYELLGRAVARWAFVEEGIYHVYRRITGPMDWPAAAAGFHAIADPNTRLDIVSAAMAASLANVAHIDEWTGLRGKIRKNAIRRVKLATWTIAHGLDARQQCPVTCLVAPVHGIAEKGANGEREKIHAEHIAEWTVGFGELANDLDRFWRKVS